MLSLRATPISDLRRLLGQLSFFAGAIGVAKAFLAPIWSVLPTTPTTSDAETASASVSLRRMAHALRWVQSLLTAVLNGDLTRKFPYAWEDFPPAQIVTDALPYGIGAYAWASTGPTF